MSQLPTHARAPHAPSPVQVVPTPAVPFKAPRAPLARATLTRPSRHLLALYLGALLALAFLGAQNQLAYGRHERLLEQKRTLQAQLQGLRLEAADASGALAVRRWALQRGMVAAPEALNRQTVPRTAAPRYSAPAGRLEMYTLWR